MPFLVGGINADRMKSEAENGLRLIKGTTTGYMKNDQLYAAEQPHSMRVRGIVWPSATEIGDLVTERIETEKRLQEIEIRLREMNIGV